MQLKQREKRGPLILFTQYPVRMTANWMAGVFDFRGSGVGGKWGLHGAAIFFCQLPFLCSFCEPFFIVCSSGFLVFFFCLLLFGIKNVLCCVRFEQPTLHMLRGRGWVKGGNQRSHRWRFILLYILYTYIYMYAREGCAPRLFA